LGVARTTQTLVVLGGSRTPPRDSDLHGAAQLRLGDDRGARRLSPGERYAGPAGPWTTGVEAEARAGYPASNRARARSRKR
jgi:hypothetical protein